MTLSSEAQQQERTRAVIAQLVEAHVAARESIARGRQSLYEAHLDPKTGQPDADGQSGCDEYDTVLAKLDAALSAGRAEIARLAAVAEQPKQPEQPKSVHFVPPVPTSPSTVKETP